jgi:hypothetical protein
MEKITCIYYFLDQNQIPFYVGLTKNLHQRTFGHLFEIVHNNMLPCYTKVRKLIKDFNLDFKKDIIKCIEICREDELEEKEILHIKLLRESGYKLKNLTEGGRGSTGYSEEINKRAGDSRRGQRRSEETKLKLSEALKGKPKSEEHKKALKKARNRRPLYSEETKRKMSESSKGKVNIKKYKLVDPNGNVFITEEGLTKFCQEHGLHAANLHKVINGERKNHKGWVAYPIDI